MNKVIDLRVVRVAEKKLNFNLSFLELEHDWLHELPLNVHHWSNGNILFVT